MFSKDEKERCSEIILSFESFILEGKFDESINYIQNEEELKKIASKYFTVPCDVKKEIIYNNKRSMDNIDQVIFYLIMLSHSPSYFKVWKNISMHYRYNMRDQLEAIKQNKLSYMTYIRFLELIRNSDATDWQKLKEFCKDSGFWIEAHKAAFEEMKRTKDENIKNELAYFFANNIEKLDSKPVHGIFNKQEFIRSVTDYINIINNNVDETILRRALAIHYENEGLLDNAFEELKKAYKYDMSVKPLFDWAYKNNYINGLMDYFDKESKANPNNEEVFQIRNLSKLIIEIQDIEKEEFGRCILNFIKKYPNPPGIKELENFNRVVFDNKYQNKAMKIFNILNETYPRDYFIKKANADLLIKIEGKIDEALSLYYEVLIHIKDNSRSTNINKNISIESIINGRIDFAEKTLPLFNEENELAARIKSTLSSLIILHKKIVDNPQQDKLTVFKDFCSVIKKHPIKGIIDFLSKDNNRFLLDYEETIDIINNYNIYEAKKNVLSIFRDTKTNNSNIDDILYFTKKISNYMYKILKNIDDYFTDNTDFLDRYLQVLMNNSMTDCYENCFLLLNHEKNQDARKMILLLTIELFNFKNTGNYYISYLENIGIDDEWNKDRISELIETSLAYYNDDPKHFIQYGFIMMKRKNWIEARNYFIKANSKEFLETKDKSDTAFIYENLCNLYIMAEERTINYDKNNISYILKALSRTDNIEDHLSYLNKLCNLLEEHDDPLKHAVYAFKYALENNDIRAIEEMNRARSFLGEWYNVCRNNINKILKKTEDVECNQEDIDSYEEIASTTDHNYINTTDNINSNDLDLDSLFQYFEELSSDKSIDKLLEYTPLLSKVLDNVSFNKYKYEILKREIQGENNIERIKSDELKLKILAEKCLEAAKIALEYKDVKSFCEFILKYLKVVMVSLQEKRKFVELLHYSFEALLVAYYESKINIKSNWKYDFNDALDNIILFYENISEPEDLFDNLIFLRWVNQFFSWQKNWEKQGYLYRLAPRILGVFQMFINLSELIDEYKKLDNTSDKRDAIENIKKEIPKIKAYVKSNVNNKKYREKYMNVCTNFEIACTTEREKLRKRANIDCKILNVPEDRGIDSSLHFYVKNIGDTEANNVNVSIEINMGNELIDTKHYKLGDLRKNRGTSFEVNYSFNTEGEYEAVITSEYFNNGEKDYFTCRIPFQLEKRTKDFKRTPTSIYLNDPVGTENSYFYGREEEFIDIEDNFLYGGNHSFFIHGLRRVGKSSLLNYVKQSFKEKCYSVMCNADRGTACKTTDELVYSIFITEIMNAFKYEYNLKLDELTFDEFSSKYGSAMEKFDAFLRSIENTIGEKSLIILIDEFEGLLRHFDGSIDNILPDIRRIALDRSRKVYFIFAGGEDIVNRTQVTLARIADSSRRIRLGFLNEADAIKLIKIPAANRLTYTDESIERIMLYTKGHPYYIVQICSSIIKKINKEKTKNIVYPQDVEWAVKETLVGNDFFVNLEEVIVDQCEIAIMILMGRFLKHEDDSINIKKLIEIFKVVDTKCILEGRFFNDDIRGSADNLVEKNVLEKVDNGVNPSYKFTLELWRLWYKNVNATKWKEWMKANNVQVHSSIEEIEEEVTKK